MNVIRNLAGRGKPDVKKLSEKKDVRGLIKALGYDDEQVRQAAAKALGWLFDRQAVAPLIDALQDHSDGVRQTAASALGTLGDRQAVAPLIKALQDGSNSVRWSAATSLGQLGDGQAVAPLINALRDNDNVVRLSAATSLGQLGDGQAVAPLIQALQHDPFVSHAAGIALSQIPDARAIEALTKAIEQGRVKMDYYEKQRTLGKLRGEVGAQEIRALMNRGELAEAIDHLGKIGYQNDEPKHALRFLSGGGEPWVEEFLVRAFQEARYKSDIIEVLWEKGVLPAKLVMPAITDDRQVKVHVGPGEQKTQRLQEAAVAILKKPGNREQLLPFLDECIALLQDKHYSNRVAAIEVLGIIHDPRAAEPLRKAAQDDKGRFVANPNDLSQGRTVYEVRDAANKVLAGLHERR